MAAPKPAAASRSQIEQRAREVLERHGLFSVPVDPVILANREGIQVHNATFSDSNLSGMVAKKGDKVVLLVNRADPPYRKRFTIAHELAHHFLHLTDDGEFVDDKVNLFRDTEGTTEEYTPERRMEIEANRFAAALLMPSVLVLNAKQSTKDLTELARKFNVSEEAMSIRLLTVELD